MARGERTALDSTFGRNGIVIIDSPVMMQNNRIAVQADGKIVVAGTYYYYLLPSFDMVYELRIMRFLQDGKPDTSFNGTGLYTKNTRRSTRLAALNIQPDGKILVTGSTGILERYLPSGAPDLSFNDSARVVLNYLGPYDYLSGTAVQQDGRIVTTGMIDQGYMLVARFKPDGHPDSTFGYRGKVTTILDSAYSVLGSAVVVQPDGKILVAGSSRGAAPDYQSRFAVVRYLTDGYLDPSFNGKGYTRIAFDGLLYCSAFTIDLLPNGKMIVGGLGYNQAVNGQLNTHRCIAKLTASGIPDNAFNGNGMVIVDSLQRPSIGSNWAPPCLKLQADGKILLSTTSGSLPYNEYFSLLRLDTAGMPDYAFGDRGRVITDVTPNEDLPYDIAVQGDGKILLCGVADQDTAWPQSLHSAPAIVRYLPNINLGIPPPDTSFADMQVYPNPAREALTLSYSINKGSAVSVQLRNIQGQLVQRWMDSERRTAGNHKEVLSLSEALAAGTYILSVAVDGAQHAFLITRQ